MALTFRILILLVVIFFASCHEAYYPEDLDDQKEILVIEGYIDNGPGPYSVLLSLASAYNESNYEPVKKAIVSISDNFLNSEILTEYSGGRYLSTQGIIKGVPGRIYTLHIELEEGDIYESDPAAMPPVNEIDTIYAEPGTKEISNTDIDGKLTIDKSIGLFVYTDMTGDSSNKRFFRFNGKFVVQRHYYRIYNGGTPDVSLVPTFLWWPAKLNEDINVKSTFVSSTENVIKKHYLGFLPYIFSFRDESDTNTLIYPRGWGVTVSAYSITENAYEYYNSILTQINADDRLFDPIPTQISGNINCLSDSSKLALGFFEVASKITRNTGFFWLYGQKNVITIDLPEYSAPTRAGRQDSLPPDFWIEFY